MRNLVEPTGLRPLLRGANGRASLLAALAGSFVVSCRPETGSGCWVADRGAGALVRLDPELIPRQRIPFPGPVLAQRAGATLWLATEGEEGELFVLEEGTPRRLDHRPSLGRVLALAGGPARDAVVLARREGEPACLWRIPSGGPRRLLAAFEDAVALASRGPELLVGCAGGRLALLGAEGGLRGQALVRGGVQALAAGPGPLEWWVVGGSEEPTLELRRDGLELRYGVLVGRGPVSLAPVEGREQVWLVAGPRLRLYGSAGALELELGLPDGPWRAAAAISGGVLLVSHGAVLEVRASGGALRILRTQGGFADLSALVPL